MTSGEPDQRLLRLLGGSELAGLRRRLRRHFERAESYAPAGSIRLANVAPHEYSALASLMGRRPRQASSIEVDIAQIDAMLARAGIAASLRAALEALDGAIVHLSTALAESFSRWAKVAESPRHPGLARLLQSAKGLGLLKRLARQDPGVAERICSRADLALLRLPLHGQPRAQLAAEALGDAHALDSGEPVATLVLAVLRQERLTPDIPDVTPESERQASPSGAPDADPFGEDDRTLWARAGVLVNELARPALLLNLPTEGGGTFAGEVGEPAYATLRRLLRSPPRLAVAGRTVYVCENPNLMAIAADRLGRRCAPLVCADGMPAAAQRTLLARLVECGAELAYHGDFDWPGLRIATFVMRSFNARPWRFGAEDYRAYVPGSSAQALSGTPTLSPWDPVLVLAMRGRGLAIPEEAVAATLLLDLQR
jgi:uncharacterized protein (TIGR02679 family)